MDGDAPPTPLTDGPDDLSVDWSPDGERLAYTAGSAPRRIKLVDPDNGATTTVYEAPEGNEVLKPQWSPDGAPIAFIRSDRSQTGNWTIWTIEPDGSDLTDMGVEGTAFDWSPDGRHLVVDPTGIEGEEPDGPGAGLRKVEVATGATTVVDGTAGTRLVGRAPEGLVVRPDRSEGKNDDVPPEALLVVDPQRGTREVIERGSDDPPDLAEPIRSC